MSQAITVDYQTDPSQYKHWSIKFEGEIATLQLNINEDGGIRPGYKLKLNSYDLGVDIELADAVQRLSYHPGNSLATLRAAHVGSQADVWRRVSAALTEAAGRTGVAAPLLLLVTSALPSPALFGYCVS